MTINCDITRYLNLVTRNGLNEFGVVDLDEGQRAASEDPNEAIIHVSLDAERGLACIWAVGEWRESQSRRAALKEASEATRQAILAGHDQAKAAEVAQEQAQTMRETLLDQLDRLQRAKGKPCPKEYLRQAIELALNGAMPQLADKEWFKAIVARFPKS